MWAALLVAGVFVAVPAALALVIAHGMGKQDGSGRNH